MSDVNGEGLPSAEVLERVERILSEADVSLADAAEDPTLGAFATFFTQREQARFDEAQGDQ